MSSQKSFSRTIGNHKSPLRKVAKESIFKNHDLIQKIYEARVNNADGDIFTKMQSDLDTIKKDGKRLFLDRVNNSNAENMHEIDLTQ